MDEKRMSTGIALLSAADDFYKACQEEGQRGAVQWLLSSNGELLIYTRGEYREMLMRNIDILGKSEQVHTFGESLESEEEGEVNDDREN